MDRDRLSHHRGTLGGAQAPQQRVGFRGVYRLIDLLVNGRLADA
jgi:hypothetical protein